MKNNRFLTPLMGEQSYHAALRESKKSASYDKKTLFSSWDTRTRTKNDRTRICCVTITPYPKIKYDRCRFASAKVVFFFDTAIRSGAFFLKKQIYFMFYAFCSYLALTL